MSLCWGRTYQSNGKFCTASYPGSETNTSEYPVPNLSEIVTVAYNFYLPHTYRDRDAQTFVLLVVFWVFGVINVEIHPKKKSKKKFRQKTNTFLSVQVKVIKL